MVAVLTHQSAMIFVVVSLCLSCIVTGIMIGVWYQKKRSDEETRLLVGMWENLAKVNEDIDFLMSFHDDTNSLIKEMRITQELDLDATQIIDVRNKI